MNKKYFVFFSLILLLLMCVFFIHRFQETYHQRGSYSVATDILNSVEYVKQISCEMTFQSVVKCVGIPRRILYFYVNNELPEDELDRQISKRILMGQYHNIEISSLEQIVEILSNKLKTCFNLWNYTFESVGNYGSSMVCSFIGEQLMICEVQFKRNEELPLFESAQLYQIQNQIQMGTISWKELFIKKQPSLVVISYSHKEGEKITFLYKKANTWVYFYGDFQMPKSSVCNTNKL